jgi:hypothetical protein
MKPITYYYKKVDGWDEFPNVWFPFLKEGEGEYFRSFGNRSLGIQMTVDTLRVLNDKVILHVSMAPIFSLREDITKEALIEEISEKASNILVSFFGDLKFERMPDDPKSPHVRHYYHYIAMNPFSEN